MKKCANWISNHSLLIVIISCLLLIPSIYGYNNTKINYDILSYLPEDIETIKGQEILTNEFDIGSFSFILTDSKNNQNLLKLEEKIKKIESYIEKKRPIRKRTMQKEQEEFERQTYEAALHYAILVEK